MKVWAKARRTSTQKQIEAHKQKTTYILIIETKASFFFLTVSSTRRVHFLRVSIRFYFYGVNGDEATGRINYYPIELESEYFYCFEFLPNFLTIFFCNYFCLSPTPNKLEKARRWNFNSIILFYFYLTYF